MYKIYWTSEDGSAKSEEYLEMVEALTRVNHMRTLGMSYVAMVSENPNQIGKMGCDGIVNGLLPNGEEYTWKKRRDS
jgi:hypothetical protein